MMFETNMVRMQTRQGREMDIDLKCLLGLGDCEIDEVLHQRGCYKKAVIVKEAILTSHFSS